MKTLEKIINYTSWIISILIVTIIPAIFLKEKYLEIMKGDWRDEISLSVSAIFLIFLGGVAFAVQSLLSTLMQNSIALFSIIINFIKKKNKKPKDAAFSFFIYMLLTIMFSTLSTIEWMPEILKWIFVSFGVLSFAAFFRIFLFCVLEIGKKNKENNEKNV